MGQADEKKPIVRRAGNKKEGPTAEEDANVVRRMDKASTVEEDGGQVRRVEKSEAKSKDDNMVRHPPNSGPRPKATQGC